MKITLEDRKGTLEFSFNSGFDWVTIYATEKKSPTSKVKPSKVFLSIPIKDFVHFLNAAQQGVQLTAAGVESDGENQDSGGN